MGDILTCIAYFGFIILVIIGMCCGISSTIDRYVIDRDVWRLILELFTYGLIILVCIYLLSPLFT